MAKIVVISGGQTGVDQAAFDAALDLNIDIDGFAPADGQCESGPIPSRYLEKMRISDGGYAKRTRQNIRIADVTVVMTMGIISPGSRLTINECERQQANYIVLRTDKYDDDAVKLIQAAMDSCGFDGTVRVNFAGPRASKVVDCHDIAFERIKKILLKSAVRL